MPKQNRVGRPTKFTPETRKLLLDALSAGNYRNVACAYAGIHYSTLNEWLLRADDPDSDPEYAEFSDAVRKAEASAEVRDIALIETAAREGTWQAAAWLRERKNPERWGRRERTQVEVSGSGGGPLELAVGVGLDVSAIEGLLGALVRRREGLGAVEVFEVGSGEV